MTVIGTPWFVSRAAAISYYRMSGDTLSDVALIVDERIEQNEIFIGKPCVKAGERLVKMDKGCRWGIDDDPSPMSCAILANSAGQIDILTDECITALRGQIAHHLVSGLWELRIGDTISIVEDRF